MAASSFSLLSLGSDGQERAHRYVKVSGDLDGFTAPTYLGKAPESGGGFAHYGTISVSFLSLS